MAGWNSDTAAGPLGAGTVTLVEGTSFCISLPNGDIHEGSPHGIFLQDTRMVSGWHLTIDRRSLEPLATETQEPYRALFVGRVIRADGYSDSPLIVERLREVDAGITERITVWNHSREPAVCEVSLNIACDFADLFEVKEARTPRRWAETRQRQQESLVIRATWREAQKGVVLKAPGAKIDELGLSYHVEIAPHASWNTAVRIVPLLDTASSDPLGNPADNREASPSDRRRQEWVAKIPVLQIGNPSIERTIRCSYDDLGALRIEDPNHQSRVVVAAGAPWFMTLFGRDSLWASLHGAPRRPFASSGDSTDVG